jgi:hypothetical protein
MALKLYILALSEAAHKQAVSSNWQAYNYEYLVVAESEAQARRFASDRTPKDDGAGEENWLDSDRAECKLISSYDGDQPLGTILMTAWADQV